MTPTEVAGLTERTGTEAVRASPGTATAIPGGCEHAVAAPSAAPHQTLYPGGQGEVVEGLQAKLLNK